MIINKKIIKELEHKYRKLFPDDLRQYLIVKYAEEPFPYELSEQDFYTNIRQDIVKYEYGELDNTVKSPSELWREEREYLQNMYLEKLRELKDLEKYVAELEQILINHDLESSRMAKRVSHSHFFGHCFLNIS